MGLEVAAWLASKNVGQIVLLSRHQPSHVVQERIQAIRTTNRKVMLVAMDVSKEKAWSGVLKKIADTKLPLKGVFHLAGVLSDSLLVNTSWTAFEAVYQAKVDGLLAYAKTIKQQPLEFEVYFSSFASLTGNIGQANYASANAFVNAFSQARRHNGLKIYTIQWGAIAGAGMVYKTQRQIKHFSDQAMLSIQEVRNTLDHSVR